MMKYGKDARVANRIVFSRTGAVEVYKTLCRMFNEHPSMETSVVMSNAADDLMALGFTPEQIEEIEISTMN